MPISDPTVNGRTADAAARPAAGGAAAPRPFMASFLDHLIRSGTITPDTAQRAVAMKQQNPSDRRSVIELLHEEFRVGRDVLQFQVAQFYAFRTIELNDRAKRRMQNADIMRLLRGLSEALRTTAMKHKVLPYDLVETIPAKLVVVTPNPSDRETSEVARSFPYKKFELCYMKESEWDELWRQISSDRSQPKAATVVADVAIETEELDIDAVLDREIGRVQLSGLIENVLAEAITNHASAIHLVPRSARKTEAFFRINGVLSPWCSFDDVRAEAVATVIKGRTPGMDRYDRLAAQQGTLMKTADGRIVHLRVSSVPMALRDQPGKYELVVIEIEREPEQTWKLDTLGLDPVAMRAFQEVLSLRHGLVVLTGPADSGVTTTMAALLRALASPTLSAIAVEEHMQFAFDGVCHVRLTPKLDYEQALTVLRRHDPDVVVLGEIQDRQGAELALRLAMAGRQVFARMQAASTAGALLRLHGFGVEPYLLAQGLTLVHAQRLVRELCPQCRQPLQGIDGRLMRLGIPTEGVRLYAPVGCVECVGGYSGRLPLHETLIVTNPLRSMLVREPRLTMEATHAILQQQGVRTMIDSATALIGAGRTTVDELWTALF